MSVHAAQLNKTGYVAKTSLSSSSVASGTGANKGTAAGLMRKSGYSTYSSLGPFTKSQPVGRQIQAMNANAIASRANRPAGQSWAYTPQSTMQEVKQIQVQAPDTGTKWWQAALYAAPTLVGALGAGMELFSGPKSNPTGNNVTTPPASSVPSSSSSEVQGLLNNLRSAGAMDSGTLYNAIAEANGKLSEMQGQTPQIQAEAQSANDLKGQVQEKVTEAAGNVSTAKSDLGEAKRTVDVSEQAVTKAEAGLKEAMNAKGIKNDQFINAHSNTIKAEAHAESMKAKHSSATAAKGQAQSDVARAETDLSKTPKTKPGPNNTEVPNEPAYSNAQRAVEQAKLKLQQAEQAEKDAAAAENSANDALTKARASEESAKAELSDAEKQVVDSQDAFSAQEKGLSEAQKGLDNAKTVQEICTDTLERMQEEEKSVKEWAQSITDQTGKLQTHLKDIEDLQKGIEAANKQLEKLQAQEGKEKASIDKKITKNEDKIATLNKNNNFLDAESSKSERKDFAKMTGLESENNALAAKGQVLGNNQQLSQAYQDVMTRKQGKLVVGGHTYYSNGDNIFIRDGKPTTKMDYLNAQMMS